MKCNGMNGSGIRSFTYSSLPLSPLIPLIPYPFHRRRLRRGMMVKVKERPAGWNSPRVLTVCFHMLPRSYRFVSSLHPIGPSLLPSSLSRGSP